MGALTVIAIFDIGKTNKKLFLFNERYEIVYEESVKLEETVDEDGFPCEDIKKLAAWITNTFARVMGMKKFIIRAVNVSAYGASLVHLDESGRAFLPVYNYLKPYPADLQKQFSENYGSEEKMAMETASPASGNLNSGMQLYYLKYRRPESYGLIRWTLHLPQYLSYLLSANRCSEITSLGCHTSLWDFNKTSYHEWVQQEGLLKLLPPICETGKTGFIPDIPKDVSVGIGLHDSSAALIPYLTSFSEPFVLISTGTWCISLNPFNHSPLTASELKEDCLCYLTHNGKPVKASRIFAGNEHEQQVKKLSAWFNKPLDYYKTVAYNDEWIALLKKNQSSVSGFKDHRADQVSEFPGRDLSSFDSYELAYHQLLLDIIFQQTKSAKLVIQDTGIKRIFVDGGFSKNTLFMILLAGAFPGTDVYAASVSQASAIGAALVIHKSWNNLPFPEHLIDLKQYYSSFIKT